MRTLGLIVLFVVVAWSAACQPPPPPPPAPAVDPPFLATSTIRELMQSMVAPSAQGLWDSVGRVSDAKGTRDLEPKSAEEWAAVRRHAVSLMESTNLLLIPGRHVASEGQQTLKADDAVPGSELPRQRSRSESMRPGAPGPSWHTPFTGPRRPCSTPSTRRTSRDLKVPVATLTPSASPAT